jgi:GH15 family glucan-1,4-alpha-glucosidase
VTAKTADNASATLDLGVIGNCQVASLIDAYGTHVWTCLPRLDGDPVFCQLLGGSNASARAGRWQVELLDRVASSQSYERNTAIVETTLTASDGAVLKITDFCPRFPQHGRSYRPAMLVRVLQRVAGRPRIRMALCPAENYGERTRRTTAGSHHIRYLGRDFDLRLTTDASIAAIQEQRVFVVEDSLAFILGPDETVHESVPMLAQRLLDSTREYWNDWVRTLAIPFEWQEAVIRAAITLKLCSYEDTGAIIAAITTSIPESPNSGRNWDYRFCWIRDSYFTIQALNRLGATRTMEGYIRFVQNLTATPPLRLQPCYAIDGDVRLDETVVRHLPGYRDMGPVRIGNAAYAQVQLDMYGAAILAAAQTFFDDRLVRPGTEALFQALEPLGEQSLAVFGQPDAGIWEYRGHTAVHTFSAAMCWGGADRLARIADRLGLHEREQYWRQHADDMAQQIRAAAWSATLNSFTSTFNGDSVDASLLLLAEVGLVDGKDPMYVSTVQRIGETLRRGPFLARYVKPDDFGVPDVAFSVCTFWYINALWATGSRVQARELFEEMLRHRNGLGLMSEDLAPESGELWGNYPQTYSMVGIVNCAMRLSRSWEDAM